MSIVNVYQRTLTSLDFTSYVIAHLIDSESRIRIHERIIVLPDGFQDRAVDLALHRAETAPMSIPYREPRTTRMNLAAATTDAGQSHPSHPTTVPRSSASSRR